ncbi:MAG: NAD-dependent deacylase [Hyphomicrobiales bacterium]
MARYKSIVILTGAGLSAESGLSTFRDKDGIWAKHDYREVATPRGFSRNPAKVLEFYNTRRKGAAGVKPNAAHEALARLEHEYRGGVLTVTQNIDPLHEMAGSRNLIHMHGEIARSLCALCDARHDWPAEAELTTETPCPGCGACGGMRPDVVWFGEMPYHMDRIYDALSSCDLFLSVGTSGTVYPAAGFVAEAIASGAHTVELNLEPSEGTSLFHERIHGPATKIVPDYVAGLLGRASLS